MWTSFRIFKILKVTCCSFDFSLASSLKKRTESITLFSRVTCFYIFTLSRMKCKLLYTWLPILIGFLCWFCLLWFARLPPWYCYTKVKPFSWCSLLSGKFGIKVLVQCESIMWKTWQTWCCIFLSLMRQLNSSSAHPLLRILAGNLLTILSRGWGIWNFTTGQPFAYPMMTLLPKLTIL